MNRTIHTTFWIIPIALVLSSCNHEVVPDWTHVTVSPFDNINEIGISNPVLTAADVNDVEDPNFVADPFLFYEDDVWYMFFEVAEYGRYYDSNMFWGRIGLARSPDGFKWTYDRIVLDDIVRNPDDEVNADRSTHHSYPLVLKYNDKYYMVTESYLKSQIRFYEAANFPYEWERVYTITKCGDVPEVSPGQCIATRSPNIGDTDPSIFWYNNKWWMFASCGFECYLYYSDELLGEWAEHPNSPIVCAKDPNAPRKARPGGRAFVFDNDRIIRLAQKCDERYGQRVRAFEVTTLPEEDEEEEYEEHEISGGAPFCESGGIFCESGDEESCERTSCEDRDDVWNLCGMHHFDAWWTGDYWLIVTDGYKCLGGNDDWSIGIYVSGTPRFGGREPFEERDIEIRQDVRKPIKTRRDVRKEIETRPRVP